MYSFFFISSLPKEALTPVNGKKQKSVEKIPFQTRCVFVFLGAELIFFIVATKGLCFGFLLETVLITERMF